MFVTSFVSSQPFSCDLLWFCLWRDIYVVSSHGPAVYFLPCVCIMVNFLWWFPALSRDYSWSVGDTVVLWIRSSDKQSWLRWSTNSVQVVEVQTYMITPKFECDFRDKWGFFSERGVLQSWSWYTVKQWDLVRPQSTDWFVCLNKWLNGEIRSSLRGLDSLTD